MSLVFSLIFLLQLWFTAATNLVTRNNTSGFVTVQGGRFQLNGGTFRFYGTNAYWAQTGSDDDLDVTFHSMATVGLQVVRVWAFNDVPSQPSSGTYFQILSDGQATINEGADGLQRLDKVVATANKYGLKLVLTLTNNWNPTKAPPSSYTPVLPRGFLSNDYGGIDLYVQAFNGGTHDSFYTDSKIISAFKNYLAHVIPRYANDPTILAWELGNDLRCSSTLPASSSCKTTTITSWVNEVSGYIKSLDSNHLVTAGDGGFYCLGCSKLYAKTSTPPSKFSGSSFDGSYGVDTEDILAVPCIDFGSFQLFPDQVQYFSESDTSFATKAIMDGGQWVAVHSDTATLLGKPEVLTAAAIVTKENWNHFIPFNETARRPEGKVCKGVMDYQRDYAFTSWAGAALNGNVQGVLEYLWLQAGLTSTLGKLSRRQVMTYLSFNDGNANYASPATGQSASAAGANLPTSF